MTAGTFSTLLSVGAIGVLAGLAFFSSRHIPKCVFMLWAAGLFFVPVWIGAQFGVYISAITALSIIVLASMNWSRLSPSAGDLLVLAFVLLILVVYAFGWSTWGYTSAALLGWIIPYVAGRTVVSSVSPNWVYSTIAIAASLAAVLAVVEFATHTNLFISLHANNGLYAAWSSLQVRGGLLRAEGAFGHSIALGAALAASSAFILSTKWPMWLRLVLLGVVTLGTGVTLSRIGLVGLGLTVVCSLIFLRDHISRGARLATILMLTVIAGAGLPWLLTIFNQAGDEAAGSAEYRSDLLVLLRQVSLLGLSPSWEKAANGETSYGSFQSIDSEMILTALRFGLIPLLVLLAGLVAVLISAVRGRATPASVALLGQIPALATVALITQYATLVWFVAGLAVATSGLNYSQISSPRTVESRPNFFPQEHI